MRGRTEITTVSGQLLLTCADWTWRIPPTRCATAEVLTRMSGRPGGIWAAASTCARETMEPTPVTRTERTTRNRDPSSAQATPATIATAARPKNTAFHPTRDGPPGPGRRVGGGEPLIPAYLPGPAAPPPPAGPGPSHRRRPWSGPGPPAGRYPPPPRAGPRGRAGRPPARRVPRGPPAPPSHQARDPPGPRRRRARTPRRPGRGRRRTGRRRSGCG